MRSVHFVNKNQNRLAGDLYVQEADNTAVIISHTFPCSGGHDLYKQVSKVLGEQFLTLSFDYSGCGKSDGDFKNHSISTQLKDLQAAISYLKKQFDVKKIGLWGHGFGAIPVLLEDSKEVAAVVAVSSYADLKIAMAETFNDLQLRDLKDKGHCVVIDPETRKQKILGLQFLRDLNRFDLMDNVKHKFPRHFIHGTVDEIIPYKQSQKLYNHAGEGRHIDFVQGADHFFSDDLHRKMLIELSIRFFRTHLLGKRNPY